MEKRIFHLRQTYQFGPRRIAWYLQRYLGIEITGGGVSRVLLRKGLNRLPRNQRKRSIVSFRRYEKQVRGHQVQMDVKFLDFVAPAGRRLRRFQYTAIDDSTRIRALRIRPWHTQANAIKFFDYVQTGFPFRIKQVRTDRGHEFQALCHWHGEDLGIEHVHIRPRTPRLNGKVERSHRTDEEEFYQVLTYTDDMDLNQKLKEWENFYKPLDPTVLSRARPLTKSFVPSYAELVVLSGLLGTLTAGSLATVQTRGLVGKSLGPLNQRRGNAIRNAPSG